MHTHTEPVLKVRPEKIYLAAAAAAADRYEREHRLKRVPVCEFMPGRHLRYDAMDGAASHGDSAS